MRVVAKRALQAKPPLRLASASATAHTATRVNTVYRALFALIALLAPSPSRAVLSALSVRQASFPRAMPLNARFVRMASSALLAARAARYVAPERSASPAEVGALRPMTLS